MKEDLLNSQFDHRNVEYKAQNEEVFQLERRKAELDERVMNLQIEFKGLDEEVIEIKQRMENLSTTVTDTGPIVKIKDAFQRLRNETRQLEVKIGVVSHTLMQAKLRQHGGADDCAYGNEATTAWGDDVSKSIVDELAVNHSS